MLVHTAEESFRGGLDAMERGNHLEALALFEAALELEWRSCTATPQARYRSYYGLCLATRGERLREAVRLSREAVEMEGYNADLHANLGRVLLMAGNRREAHRTFVAGLRLQPGHAGITRELRGMGVRRRPPLPFLPRSHPINRVLGRLTCEEASVPARERS